MKFIAPLIAVLRKDPTKSHLNAYLCQSLEFLTVCAQSQHNLMDLLFSQPMVYEAHGLCEDFVRFFMQHATLLSALG